MKSYKAELKYFEEQKNRPTLESLIEGKPYDKAIAELKEIAEDKGYTAAWLKQQTAQLNKDYHTYLQRAVEDYNAQLEKVKDKYQTANGVYFEHNYTAADYADLQFLQTLIKTRILNESGNNPVLVERILKDYINTVKGARAVMFLANDSEIGKYIKPHYDMAVNNAQTAAEKRFVAEKEATLDKIADEINRMEVNRTIGAALLKQSNERVTADFVDRANAIYWGSEDKGKVKMFEIEKLGVYARPLNYSYTADFATCREKPEIQPSNVINETLDFLRGDKKQVKSPIEQHETIYRDNESNHKTNDTVYTVTRNLDDTPIEDTVPDITIEDTENAEIQAKSKKAFL